MGESGGGRFLRAGLDGPATPTLAGQRFRLPGEDGAPGFGGFPPIRQKNGEWMGHGRFFFNRSGDLFPAFLRRGRNDLVSDGQRGGLRADYAVTVSTVMSSSWPKATAASLAASASGLVAMRLRTRSNPKKLSGGIAGLKQSIV